MRIRTKFSLFTGALVVALTLGISGAVYSIERSNLVANLDREQVGQTRSFALVSQQALTISDMLFLINYISKW